MTLLAYIALGVLAWLLLGLVVALAFGAWGRSHHG